MESNINLKQEVKKEKVISPGALTWKRLKKNKLAIAGLIVLISIIIISVFGPLLSPYKSDYMDVEYPNIGPCTEHILGTDQLGRDVLTRVMYAGRISMAVGLVAVCVEVVIGSILGAIAGYYGGSVDGIIMRMADIFMCVPFFPMLITIGALFSDLKVNPNSRLIMVMFIMGALGWPGICRIVRGQILTLREQEFMQLAEATGLSDKRKIYKHLLPNTFPSIIVAATLGIGGAILTESSLSFLGLGVVPPTPSWGNMIQVVQNLYSLQNYPWLWVPPGLLILLTVMAINLFGDGLRDALDPKLRK